MVSALNFLMDAIATNDILSLKASFSINSFSFSAKSVSLKSGIRKPFSPSSIISAGPEMQSYETTGRPADKASPTTFGKPSELDEKANILDCNENMYKKLGYTKPELLALNISDIDVLESKKEILDKINKTKELGSITFKTIHKRKDGSAVLVHENLQYDRNTNEYKAIVREEHSSKK